jgi:chromosome segregation ATPase
VAFIWALFEMLIDKSSKQYYRDLWQQTHATSMERFCTIASCQAEIKRMKASQKVWREVHERVERDLNTSHELINQYIEDIASLEQLITTKDDELNYMDDYVKNGELAYNLLTSERDRLSDRVAELEKETPEHLRACLLEKLHECKNLNYLNQLLENANSGYSKELKEVRTAVDRLVRQLQENEIEPDLGPNEAATSAEPDPAEEPIEESCCF